MDNHRFLENFSDSFFTGFNKIISEYGFFDYTISPSSDITERDFGMVISDFFTRQGYDYQIEYGLGRKKTDFFIQHQTGQPHYIEIKDCGLYEIKYAKSLACCYEIEAGTYDGGSPSSLTFPDQRRLRSKTDWKNFFDTNKGRGSEGLAMDIYKLYMQYNEGTLKKGDICSCIAFVFWPQPFPAKTSNHFAKIKKGEKSIETGTKYLIKQLKEQTHMQDLTYGINTIELPAVSILNPYTGHVHQFNASDIKLTIEILSWVN